MLVPGSANPLLLRTVAAAAAGGISRSLRFNSSDSAYLSRTPASAGNRRTWTWAGWVKRSKSTSAGGVASYQPLFEASGASLPGSRTSFMFNGDSLDFFTDNISSSRLISTQVFRDFSAWFHIVLSVDTTQATASNRIRIYINGVEITVFSTSSYPTQNLDTAINTTSEHRIGKPYDSFYFDGYLADIYFIDGQALTPSSFTETDATTGQLIPKAFSGSYGSQGWHLEFADNSSNTATTLGKDTSGNGNNWTPNNLSVTAGAGNDSLVDVPTNGAQTDTGVGGEVRGNYCTLNPLKASSTLGNGNLEITSASGGQNTFATFAVSSGKWYWECSGSSFMTGINLASASLTDLTTNRAYNSDGEKYSGSSNSGYGSSFTSGDTIGVALDLDNGNLVFYKNGVSQETAFSSLSGTYSPWLRVGSATTPIFNFGQRAFAYTAPSGFKALCTANLPAPLITKPSTVMDVLLWTGNGASSRSITGLEFSPDLVIASTRSIAWGTSVADVIRGASSSGGTMLRTFNTGAEEAGNSFGVISSFDSAGFGLTKGSHGTFPDAYVNQNNATYVAWCWDAGSSTVTNTQGSITGTVSVRANTTAGFSVVTYTGNGSNATVGHGLGVAPSMVIVKSRSAANDWAVYHAANTSDPKTDYLLLNSTAATADDNTYWNDTAPTSTVFSIGTNADVNTNTTTYVAYCFAPVVGYSSFGSYTGNGSSDGPFVYTGFRPRWVICKCSSTNNGYTFWEITDTARGPYNPSTPTLAADLSDAEGSANLGAPPVDMLSNGFKIRTTGSGKNLSGQTYIYAAFAESPFNYARAR